MPPKLRFDERRIPDLASKYEHWLAEQPRVLTLEMSLLNRRDQVRSRGYLEKADLREGAQWKASTSAAHIETNSEEYIKEITEFAFRASTERARIEALTVLDGVMWPMASVILHFFHRENYPILDYRALWSVSLKAQLQYDFAFWWDYVQFCRDVAQRNGVTMRMLDRALWQYYSTGKPTKG
jgi:hypothetical protein